MKNLLMQMIEVIGGELRKHGVTLSETISIADHDAEVLIFGGPIWLGQPSSIAKRVLERMDTFLSETDERSRMPSFGKVAVAAIVGNDEGAHRVTADLFQALNDVDRTIPAGGACYWVDKAMGETDFTNLPELLGKVQQTAAMLASNAAHLARLLQGKGHPGVESL